MNAAPHMLGSWDYHPAIHGQEGVAFVIYPAGTSEPLAEVLARDGAEQIARRMAAAPALLKALRLCASICAGETVNKNGLIYALESARAAIRLANGEGE